MTGPNVRDVNLKVSNALGAVNTVAYSSGIDLGDAADKLANVEFLLTAPLLTTTQLPDAATVIYDVQTCAEPAFGSPTTIAKEILKQTGATNPGAALATVRFKPSTDCLRYVRIKSTPLTNGTCVAANMTLELLV
jgi:hypothetical protein